VAGGLDRIKSWFRRSIGSAEDEAEGSRVTTPPPGARDAERETSTNAQMEGAADEPWPGND
jgi:hypothetical protein